MICGFPYSMTKESLLCIKIVTRSHLSEGTVYPETVCGVEHKSYTSLFPERSWLTIRSPSKNLI